MNRANKKKNVPKKAVKKAGIREVSTPRPVATSTVCTNPPGRSITLTNREYCCDLTTASIVNTNAWTDLRINPGNSSLFPWLSQISRCYEYYSFSKLAFDYVPSCSTALVGTVAMAIDYDPVDDHPEDLSTFMVMDGASSSQAYTRMTCTASPKHMHVSKDRYVSTSNSPTGDRWTDVGRFYCLATGSTSASAKIGQIYVSYTLTLSAPQVPEPDNVELTLVAQNSETILPNTSLLSHFGLATQTGSAGAAGLCSVSNNTLSYALPKGSWTLKSLLTGVMDANSDIVLVSADANTASTIQSTTTSTDKTLLSSTRLLDVLGTSTQFANRISDWFTPEVSAYSLFNLMTGIGSISTVQGLSKLVLSSFRTRRKTSFPAVSSSAQPYLSVGYANGVPRSLGFPTEGRSDSKTEHSNSVGLLPPCACQACTRFANC